ncbi:galactose-specific lectin nattectin-like [Centropristis striata]|uniref:galactose-specific lectin nattectin-like n=1 Tax=Centropristis striata TaxID=184440 RepID=UPI0027E129D9|nr:galactose-specific lectin nattectin-like [Centropristis striata]
MTSGFTYIVLLCVTSGLWIEANAKCSSQKEGECITCPDGWTKFDCRCFLFIYEEKVWADAEIFCVTNGGTLTSLKTAEDYGFFRQLVIRATGANKTTWIGGYDAIKEGVWMWTDGSKFDFNGWAKGEPNNNGDEDCMEFNYGGFDYVNDIKCDNKRSFICSMEPHF